MNTTPVKLPEVDGYYWMKNTAGEEACNNLKTIWRVVYVFKSVDQSHFFERVVRDGQSIYTQRYLSSWSGVEFVGPLTPPENV